MIEQVLDRSNYVEFNSTLAHLIHVDRAVYLNELITISHKSIRKDKRDQGYFILDRQYMRERTTYDEEHQLQMDKYLQHLGLIAVSPENPNAIMVNYNTYRSILCMESSDDLITNVTVSTDTYELPRVKKKREPKPPKEKKKTKNELLLEEALAAIPDGNDALKEGMIQWVTYTWRSYGINDMLVKKVYSVLSVETKGDVNAMIAIFEKATESGWKNYEAMVKWYRNTYQAPQTRVTVTPIVECSALSGNPY